MALVEGVGGGVGERAGATRSTSPRSKSAVILAVALLLTVLSGSFVTKAPPVAITVPYSATPVLGPDLDGDPATGAWSDALSIVIPLENGEASSYGFATLYAKHDGTNAFFRLDGAIDVRWISAAGNHFWLGFQISPTGTTHHGGGTFDGVFFGLWDGTDYAPQSVYPPVAVDTNGFDRPPIKDGSQDVLGTMRYSGGAAPYSYTAEWRRPLNSGDADDLGYVADGVTTYNFFSTTDSDGGGSNGGTIRHKQVTNLNTLKFALAGAPNTPPTVDVTAPDGGERWTGATPHAILWNMSDAETAETALRVWLNYTLDGASYLPIPSAQDLTGLTCPCTHSWTTPAAEAATARVRATVLDAGGLSAADTSLASFALDSTRPTVAGTVPPDGATGVAPTTSVQVTFSEAMNQPTSQAAFSLQRMDTLGYLAGTSSWAGNTLTFSPSASLPQGVIHTGRVNATALDASDPGNAMASPYTFSFTTLDVAPPTVTAAPVPPLQESGGSVDITATVADNVGVTGVWTEVRDPAAALLGNFTMTDRGGGLYSYAAVYRPTGTYTFRVVARDAAGNWAEASGSFAIQDTTAPSITHTPPAGATVGIPIPLQATVSDNNAVAEVRVDYTDVLGVQTNATMTLAGPFYTYTIPGQPSTGTVTYFLWAIDSSGNAARTPMDSVTVFASDATPPSISSVAASPPVQDVPAATNVSATVTDNVAVAAVYLAVTDPLAVLVGNFSTARAGVSDTFYLERAYGTLGTYSFTIWATDTSGNVASSTGTFSVADRIPPTILSTTDAPDPQQVGLLVDFAANVTDNGAIDRVTLAVTDPSANLLGNFTMILSGGTYTYSSSFAAIGIHTYVVWVTDSGGNAVSSGGDFTIRDVDTSPPTISAVAANPPQQDVPGAVNVTASVTDDVSVASVFLEVRDPLGNPLGNASMTRLGATITYYDSRAPGALGTYAFTIWATDTSGNSASATGSFDIVDRVSPTFLSASDSPDPMEVGSSISFAAEVADNDAVDRVTVAITDPTATLLGNFTMVPVGPGYGYSSTFSALGVHTYAIWATDPSGNAASVLGTFTVQDTTPPTVSATGEGTYWVGTQVTFNASGSSDNLGIASIAWNFTYDGAPVVLSGFVAQHTFGIVGAYNVTATVTDLAGLQAAATLLVTVITDTTPPEAPRIDAVTPTTPGCLRVTWSPVADPTAATYRLYRWNSTEVTFQAIAEEASTTVEHEDCGLAYDTVFTYRLTTLDDLGNESPPSPMANGRTTAPPIATADTIPLVLGVAAFGAVAVVLALVLLAQRRKRKDRT